jgi:FAD:protein FMN transferase
MRPGERGWHEQLRHPAQDAKANPRGGPGARKRASRGARPPDNEDPQGGRDPRPCRIPRPVRGDLRAGRGRHGSRARVDELDDGRIRDHGETDIPLGSGRIERIERVERVDERVERIDGWIHERIDRGHDEWLHVHQLTRPGHDAAVVNAEAATTFACFGSTCSVFVIGDGAAGTAAEGVAWARSELERWHRQFTRFDPGSELSLMNGDPRDAVPVSPELAEFAELVRNAGLLTRGLVDATLLGEIERTGYTTDVEDPIDLRNALAAAPPRAPASPNPAERWRLVGVDRKQNVLSRPPGLRLDSGGLAKGLFCDLLAHTLASHTAFAVDCAGDLRVGGRGRLERAIQVASPFGGDILHTFSDGDTAAATSGIGRRSWLDTQGRPRHHLLDPSSGEPAFTGIVQVTALARRAALAEVCAKAAILSGPGGARAWLPDGGVIVYDDGSHEVVDPVGASQESLSFL